MECLLGLCGIIGEAVKNLVLGVCIYKGDAKRGVNTNDIVKTKDFYKPTEKSNIA